LIIATNHMSRMDTLLLLITPNRKDITALVADKYKRYRCSTLSSAPAGYLDHENTDFGALRAGWKRSARPGVGDRAGARAAERRAAGRQAWRGAVGAESRGASCRWGSTAQTSSCVPLPSNAC
jgi:hypothetical protein